MILSGQQAQYLDIWLQYSETARQKKNEVHQNGFFDSSPDGHMWCYVWAILPTDKNLVC